MIEKLLKETVRPHIHDLPIYQPGTPISEVQSKLKLQRVVKLASNENPLGPSPRAIEAAAAALLDVHRYPDRGMMLKEALAAKHGVGPEAVMLSDGSDSLLLLAAEMVLNPGDEALMAQYGFANYAILTRSLGAQPIIVPNASDFSYDLEGLLKAIHEHTKIIFIANPNNPTGSWIAEEDFLAFLRRVPPHVLVVCDEAYDGFVDEPRWSSMTTYLETFSNLLVLKTFSKLYGLAALRIGYALGHPRLLDLMLRLRLPFAVSTPAMAAALAALSDVEHIEKTQTVNRAGRRQLTEAFADQGLKFQPPVANFFLVNLKKPAVPIFEALMRKGVIVRPLVPYGLPEHLRISIGTSEEHEVLLEALRDVL